MKGRLRWAALPVVGIAAAVAYVLESRLRPRPMSHRMSWVLNVPLRRNEIRRIVEQSQVGPGMRVLELGCGAGAITEELARRV